MKKPVPNKQNAVMRATTTILLIILSLLASGKAWSQGKGSYSLIETEHFTLKRINKGYAADLLTPKQDYLQIQCEPDMNNVFFLRYSDKVDPIEFAAIVRDELTKPYLGAFLAPLPDEELDKLKTVTLLYYFDINQKFIGYSVETPARLLDRYPQLESIFHAWGQGVKGFDFSKYAILFNREDRFCYGTLGISLIYYINQMEKDRKRQPFLQ
ncbi:MAG: hypothetical protein PHC95_14800 [Parabacteroides sp.]|nr:hypothetical protein [Parabacteroides sp.]